MKTVRYTSANGTNLALANLMPACNRGFETAAAEVKDIIESNELDPEKLCKIFNNHTWATDKFEPYRALINGISLKVTDAFGNKSFVKITVE